MEHQTHILSDLKMQAKQIKSSHPTMTHTQSLEAVAKSLGYRNWNTCRAKALPWSAGDQIKGTYLGNGFTGEIKSLTLGVGGYAITVKFDKPIDVVKSDAFSNWRQQISTIIGSNGRSIAKTSDGQPHMILR